MFVPLPTHCTTTRFGFRTRRIDGIECGLFSNHAPLGQTALRVGRVVEVKGTVCVTVCVVQFLRGMMMKEREKVKPGAGS